MDVWQKQNGRESTAGPHWSGTCFRSVGSVNLKCQSCCPPPSISGYNETSEIEYAADTALDHMAVMDENESPVEVHVTKNCYSNFKGFAGVLHRERN